MESNVGEGYACAANESLGEPHATATMSVEQLRQAGVRGLYRNQEAATE